MNHDVCAYVEQRSVEFCFFFFSPLTSSPSNLLCQSGSIDYKRCNLIKCRVLEFKWQFKLQFFVCIVTIHLFTLFNVCCFSVRLIFFFSFVFTAISLLAALAPAQPKNEHFTPRKAWFNGKQYSFVFGFFFLFSLNFFSLVVAKTFQIRFNLLMICFFFSVCLYLRMLCIFKKIVFRLHTSVLIIQL